jgi:acetoacetyl-CoA synthetase
MKPPYVPQIRLYQQWLHERHGLSFDSYEALRRWSIDEYDAFWQSLWDCERFESPTPHRAVLADARMPGAVWFPGAQANFAQRVLRHVGPAHAAGLPAIVSDDELGRARTLSWPDLRRQVAALALALKDLGVQRGDRVAAWLPNMPETVVAFLACASVGAIWSVCAPDMATPAVLDRFRQIEPRVLIAADGMHYAGRAHDRADTVEALRAGLPTVQRLVLLDSGFASRRVAADLRLADVLARDDDATTAFEPAWLPFDHPLWIVYSSGTTGLPKPIVHGHGGILMIMAANGLTGDYACSYEPNSFGERFHWYSSTGWVMWNCQVGGLAKGSTIALYDGSPGGPKDAPDWGVLWRFAARHGVTYFGAGAAFYANCMKAGLALSSCGDLSRVRALGSTGSPLAADVQRWGSAQFDAIGTRGIWWNNISGGTDFCGVFVGSHRELPQVPGKLPCRPPGMAVEAWNDAGEPVVEQLGELVCTKPLPSMPLCFWGDPDGARYRASYFDTYPGVWRHGDWLEVHEDGSCTIYGRSDATLNRHGLRMGTSEIYAAVEALPEVLDSLVIDIEMPGRPGWMALFVVLRQGLSLDAGLRARIDDAIRRALSPRFVPDDVYQAPEIPRTLSGKKQEVPLKRIFLGQPPDKVLNRDAMANPQCVDWYLALATSFSARTAPLPGA